MCKLVRMTHTLTLSPYLHIEELEHEFSAAYPYLGLHFFKADPSMLKRLPATSLLKIAGLKKEGIVEIDDLMPVWKLESIMRDQFGLNMQVVRRSGNIWLETSMTDNWSLKQQNEHGYELSKPPADPAAADFDLERGNT